ncbi:MAG: DUF2325 domain-containing protein [Methylocystaceae bacterium]|nr:DUF2325 domain-containing protein [Methylocystaceae bacterium]
MCDLHAINKIPEKTLESHAKAKRRKLWDLDVHWHCAIVGTCFSQDEIKKLAKKCQAPSFDAAEADYKLHSFMVSQARFSKGVGRLLHKTLERKYARTIKAFSNAKTSDEVADLWQDAYIQGDIPAPFWAVMTHEASSFELLAKVYGDVHMLSHLAGASNRADHREIADLKTSNMLLQNELEETRKNTRKAIDKRDHMIGELKAELQEALTKARRSDELEALLLAERDGATIARLEKRIECLTQRVMQETDRANDTYQRLSQAEHALKKVTGQLKLKERRLEDFKQEVQLYEATLARTGDTLCMKEQGCPGGEDLCGRCIAYIGGQNKQAAFFRNYVKSKNGQFLHHDGGLHDGQARLQSILEQADAVMFPVTCVSHEATREIKRICLKQEKPFIPLRSQGLGAFTRGLESLEGEYFEKNS